MVKNRLRNVEKLILSRLELDARTPFSSFGRNIRKSQQQISYNVGAMLEKGIIQKFYTIIDYSKMDMLNFRVYFKVSYIEKEKIEELIDYLVSETHTSWISTCGGRYDLICTFLALNPSQFNKTLKNIMEKFPKQLQNYMVLTTIVNRNFGRKYLFKNNFLIKQKIFGGDRKPEQIDDIDMFILEKISMNARISSVKLSKKLSLTPKTVIQRIKKLQKRKIIRGFKPLLDQKKAGYTSNLLLIKYHNVSVELENKLISFLKVHPQVMGAVKTLGEWDIEIEIEVEELTELREIEVEIRQKFALLIQEIESIPLYRTYKKNYFPRFLIEKS